MFEQDNVHVKPGLADKFSDDNATDPVDCAN